MEPNRERQSRILCGILLLIFGLILVEPLRMRAKGPSIYADDVVRIAQVRTMPLAEMLVRPFNEHLAPLFEAVTAATWSLCRDRLTRTPLAFTLASLLPFLLCEFALFVLLWRETRSCVAGLIGLAVFGVTWLPIETAWWYSASSFAWSLLGVLVAWLAVLKPGWKGMAIALLASLSAPAFSMIGILAGPIAVLRGGIDLVSRENNRHRHWTVLLPLGGTAGFLLFASLFGHRSALAGSVRQNVHVREALGPILRAPVTVLLPALAGVKDLDATIPYWAAGSLTVLMTVALLMLAAKRRESAGLVLGGLGLIALGYGLTYAARAGSENLLNVQRYHLFPQAGLAMIVAALIVPLARRVESQPVRGMSAAVLIALVLLAAHRDELKGRARHLRFDGQGSTLAAMEHLEHFCDSSENAIGRDQALSALDPVRKTWFDFDLNALIMMAPHERTDLHPPQDARLAILSALSREEREALWGGMDVTSLAGPSEGTCVAEGRLDHSFRIPPPPSELPEGLSYLEYQSDLSMLGGEEPRTLRLDGLPSTGTVEVWWKGRKERWGEAKSVRLEPAAIDRAQGRVHIPLQSLPHWDRSDVERLQIRFHGPGRLGMVEPRFYR